MLLGGILFKILSHLTYIWGSLQYLLTAFEPFFIFGYEIITKKEF